jgi:XapX domain-containing protein
MPYIVSLGGLGIGMIYALIDVRSPAPPLVALVGLLGMVLGEQAVLQMRGRPVSPSAAATPDVRASPTTPSTRRRGDTDCSGGRRVRLTPLPAQHT